MEYSLEYKIGQMLLCGFRGTDAASASATIRAIRELHLGGVWLTDADSPLGRTSGNIESPQQLQALINDLKAAAGIPLFVAIDAEGGQVIRLKEKYGFPPTRSAARLGEIDDEQFTYTQAAEIARRLKDLGINFNFAPVVDLALNPSNPALAGKERCLSADAQTVIRHARQFILAHREAGVLSCLKHFPGHGSAAGDTHLGLVDASAQWKTSELLPFKTLIGEGLTDAVLASHLFIKQIDPRFPVPLSSKAVNGLLRDELGFNGVVLSDDLNMGAIRRYYTLEETVERAIGAGIDILVFSNHKPYEEDLIANALAIIKNLIDSGKVSVARIEHSFKRIMRLKQKLHLK